MPNSMWPICFCLIVVLTLVEPFLQNDGIHQYFSTKPEVSIINGEVCTPHCMPFIVGINLETTYGSDFCSGSLISPNYVLTAAHCLEIAIKAEVVFGAHDITVNEPTQVRQWVKTDNFIIHPGWRGEKVLTHDLALIRLPQPVDENAYIKIVKLATGTNRFVDKIGRVAGWGITKNGQTTITPLLRYIDAAIMSNRACRLVDSSYRSIIGPTHLCLSGTSSRGQIGTCGGDSGGPLSVNGTHLLNKNISFSKDVTTQFTYRIIGGREALPHYYPFIAALMITTRNSTFFCGGSLITPQIVLTAAHCLDEKPVKIQVALGRHDLSRRESTGQLFETKSYALHRHWSRRTLNNDIALIKLPRNVTLNQYVRPIGLARSTSRLYPGMTTNALGWGQTSDKSRSSATRLREVEVIVMPLPTCRDIYGDTISRSHICTIGPGFSIKGTCNGDSGGPLLYNGVQIGIVSFGAAECLERSPSVYTNVAYYESWIKQTLEHPSSFSGGVRNYRMSIYLLLGIAIYILVLLY